MAIHGYIHRLFDDVPVFFLGASTAKQAEENVLNYEGKVIN